MSFVRQMSEDEWLRRCWDEVARLSIDGGVTTQETRDAAVLVDRLKFALSGGPEISGENVIQLPGAAARALR